MKRLTFFLVTSLFLSLTSCRQEQVSFVVKTIDWQPDSVDTTATIGTLDVFIDVTLLESTSRKSHVGDINRQLIDMYLGNPNQDQLGSMKLYLDSLQKLSMPAPIIDSSNVDTLGRVIIPHFTATVKIYPELLEGNLVTFVYENFENYTAQPGIKRHQYLAFDLKTGRRLHEQDFFDCSNENRAEIDKLLNTALEEFVEADTNGLVIDQFNRGKLHMNDNFRISAQSLFYHFDPGVIASAELGPINVEIPSYKFHPFLRQESLLFHYWFQE